MTLYLDLTLTIFGMIFAGRKENFSSSRNMWLWLLSRNVMIEALNFEPPIPPSCPLRLINLVSPPLIGIIQHNCELAITTVI